MAKKTTRLVDIILSVKDRAGANLTRVGTQAGTLTRTLTALRSVATGALGGYALVRGLQASIGAFSEFEKSLANVSTMLSGDAGPTMDRFREQVLDLSRAMGEDKGSLTTGLYDILSAGIDAAGAMDVLRTSVMAAKAGVADSADSTKLLVSVLNSYGLQADHSGRVSDVLFSTVKRGVTTFGELGQYLGQVTSLAATAGVTIEEVSAALSTMTRAGMRTDKAVTALSGIISAFIKPSEGAKNAARELGIELDTSMLRSGGLKGVLESLRDVQIEETGAIFENIEALRGVAPLVNDYAGFLNDLNAALTSSGATMEAFGKQADTTAHRLGQLRETWEGLKVATGAAAGRLELPTIMQELADLIAWDSPEKRIERAVPELIRHFEGMGVRAGTTNSFIVQALGEFRKKALADPDNKFLGHVPMGKLFPSAPELFSDIEARLRKAGKLRLSEPGGPAPGGEAAALAPGESLLELVRAQRVEEEKRSAAAADTLKSLHAEMRVRAIGATQGGAAEQLARLEVERAETMAGIVENVKALYGRGPNDLGFLGLDEINAMKALADKAFDAQRRAILGDGGGDGAPFAGRQATGMMESRFLRTAPEVRREDKVLKATEAGNKQRAAVVAGIEQTNAKLDAVTQRLTPTTVMGF